MDSRTILDDLDSERWADLAYLGRLTVARRSLLVIAGIHALGSIGAVHYLTGHLPKLYARVGTEAFSMVISSEHGGDTVTSSEVRGRPGCTAGPVSTAQRDGDAGQVCPYLGLRY